jgi:hypothetical protein
MRNPPPLLNAMLALAVVASLCSHAFGSAVTINAYLGYRSGSGGEFTITSADSQLSPASLGYSSAATVNGGFETFCLEYNQHFTPGSTYNSSISGAAIGSGGSDFISVGTAWLYSQFAKNTWDSAYFSGSNVYNYTAGSGRQASAAAFQNTIWWLEQENYSSGSNIDPGSGNIFRNAVLSKFSNLAGARVDSGGAYGVSVLNLGNAPDFKYQDQLILTPVPAGAPPAVPDGGGTVMLLGLALGGLACLKRRLQSLA